MTWGLDDLDIVIHRNKLYDAHFQDRPQAWSRYADELTKIIQSIIEFAKLIDGFMRLGQEAQIMLLKKGVFELAVILMSLLYDFETNSLLVGNHYIRHNLFQPSDVDERHFVNELHKIIHELAIFQLTDLETALYSAMVLMSPVSRKYNCGCCCICIFR